MYKSDQYRKSCSYNVFSIYDRFSSIIVKGEPSEKHTHVVRNTEINDFLTKSKNIILRTKYFKNSECAKIKTEYKSLFEESPFYIISNEENLYNKTILLISLREIRDLETYIPVGTSWEELLKNIISIFSLPEYKKLDKIKYVIIAIEEDGLIISYKDDNMERKYELICNPGAIDGYFKNHTVDYNKVSGYMSILQGYLTYKIAQKEIDIASNDKINDIVNICLQGHVGVRHLDKLGFKRGKENTIYIENEKIISHIESYKKGELDIENFPDMVYKLDFDNVISNIKSDEFHFLDYSIKKNTDFNTLSKNISCNLKDLEDLKSKILENLDQLKSYEINVKRLQSNVPNNLVTRSLKELHESKENAEKQLKELQKKILEQSILNEKISKPNMLEPFEEELKDFKNEARDLAINSGIVIVWAKYIVRYGYKRLYEKLNELGIFVPYAKFHDIISFDKNEIEQLRDIERGMIDYNRNTDLQSPLSIAVFGEPGSGKSYTIEEIAEDIFKMKKHTVLTFNISQLKNSDELIESFRLIQNAVLKDTIPIVFWDEFDSMYGQEELGWLKYFLSPMQSGKFLYNQVEYKIGRCIFIFAGGTCATHKEFVSKCKETGMKKVKAPDFLGRLKATLDIPSLSRPKDRIINAVEEKLYKDLLDLYGTGIKNSLDDFVKEYSGDITLEELIIGKYLNYELLRHKHTDRKEIYKKDTQFSKANITGKVASISELVIPNNHNKFSYILKRAMVLRQNLLKILNKGQDDELKIEDPVLNAFLMVDKYYYDSRSMIAILNLFHIQYKEFTIRTSGIPSSKQLSLHTNEKDFIKYCKCDYNELIFIKGIDSEKNIRAESVIKIMRWYQEIF